MKIHAIVKENLDNEVNDFKEFFKGNDVFIDDKKDFYGPHERKAGLTSMLSFKAISDYRAAKVAGNMKGESLVMGGVLVVGPGDQGLLYEHQEKKIGDRCNVEDVMAAVAKISQ